MSASGYVNNQGAKLYYEIAGEGPEMVFLHAGVADHRQWHAPVAHFSATHRVLCYDQRGFGQSEPVAGEFRAMDDLEAVMRAQGLSGSSVMIGCSMGGSFAMDYTIAHPQSVSALVMGARAHRAWHSTCRNQRSSRKRRQSKPPATLTVCANLKRTSDLTDCHGQRATWMPLSVRCSMR